MAASNPNKANQHIPDPRQKDFLVAYLDPKSSSYANALQSALKAGYSKEYAENIMSLMPEWLSERISDTTLLEKAEKRLNQILDIEPVDEEGKIDHSLMANQMKGIVLVTKGIGRARYSERVEHTGENGEPIKTIIINKAQ